MIYASCLKRLLCLWVAVLHIVISTFFAVGQVQAQSEAQIELPEAQSDPQFELPEAQSEPQFELPETQSEAQLTSDDEPPVLDLQIVETGVAGDSQVFSATVTDNEEILEVVLHVRFESDDVYDSVPMNQIPGTSIFTVTVDLPSPEVTVIEYYMNASDVSGNRVVRGFAFDPLLRDLMEPNELAATTEPAAVSTEPSRTGISTGRKILYVGLGILAAGAIAAALSGGGSSGDGDEVPGGGPEIPVTITVDPIATALE